jgi:catechol-2,3-dioxygenase
MKSKLALTLLVAISTISLCGQIDSSHSIKSQVVFLYYSDLTAAANFYGEKLGFQKTFDGGWVHIYQSSQNSYVGLVDNTRGHHRNSPDKPVMLSLVTEEIENWYTHLQNQEIKILSPLSDSSNFPIRSFLTEDPGGYTIEFFEWKESARKK